MPLTKTPKGWMWGSKGPFSTKAKALQVARAAYASGYKAEQNVANITGNDQFVMTTITNVSKSIENK